MSQACVDIATGRGIERRPRGTRAGDGMITSFAGTFYVVRTFKWDVKTQSVDAIDTLEPFHTAELTRAG